MPSPVDTQSASKEHTPPFIARDSGRAPGPHRSFGSRRRRSAGRSRSFEERIACTTGGRLGLRTTLLGFALLLVSFLQSSIPIEILALHLLVILAIGEILRRHVPSGIQQTMLANCERSDGSWSDRRAAIERAALRQYVKDILVPVSLIAVGSNVALLVVHHEVLPLPIGLKLLAADPTTDNSELVRDTDRHLPRWLGKDRQQRERRLAKLAPLLWVPAVVGVVGALWLFKTAYVRAVRQLASSVRMRAEQYELQTLARCQNG